MRGIAHDQLRVEWRERRVQDGLSEVPTLLRVRNRAAIGAAVGLAGGVGLVLPIVVYDWASSAHSALELPMASTSWLFGLQHFAQNGYLWGSIAIGALLLVGYAVVHGAVFAAIASRFAHLRTFGETFGAGLAWGFVGWLFFWYTLLPIARDGLPFRAVLTSGPAVAPTWVFVTGFTLLGIVTALTTRLLRNRGS